MSLTNGSHVSYECRSFKAGGIAGVKGKINSPNELEEALLNENKGQNRGYYSSFLLLDTPPANQKN